MQAGALLMSPLTGLSGLLALPDPTARAVGHKLAPLPWLRAFFAGGADIVLDVCATRYYLDDSSVLAMDWLP